MGGDEAVACQHACCCFIISCTSSLPWHVLDTLPSFNTSAGRPHTGRMHARDERWGPQTSLTSWAQSWMTLLAIIRVFDDPLPAKHALLCL